MKKRSRKVRHTTGKILAQKSKPRVAEPLGKVTNLSDFKSISDLNSHLAMLVSQALDYDFDVKAPQQACIEWMINIVKSEKNIESFEESMKTLDLISSIEHKNNRPYTEEDNDRLKVLRLCQKMVQNLAESPSATAYSQLEQFYRVYHQHPAIKKLHAIQDSANPFSPHYQLHSLLNYIDKVYSKIILKLERSERERLQMGYAQLLEKFLEGAPPEEVIPLLRTKSEQKVTKQKLLPETEYPPPMEPGSPYEIGVSEFFVDKKKQSVLDAFDTKEMEKEFLSSFPWAASLASLSKLTTAKPLSHANLLETDYTFASQTQLLLLQYILLSLDALGKLCGDHGKFALQNYAHIKDITDRLYNLSQRVQKENVDENPNFITELKDMTAYLITKNKLYSANAKNADMNNFCHINEVLSALLLGIPLESSVLHPAHATKDIEEKINKASNATLKR